MRFLRRTPLVPPARSIVGVRAAAALQQLARAAWRLNRRRARRLRSFAVIGVQAGLAAAIAWFLAYQVLRNPDPVFAPALAISAIASSIGQRIRRTLQLITGVVVGIAMGDLLIELVGTGPLQVGAVVAIAVTAAIALDGSSALMTQAGGTAVLVVALHPVNPDLELPRFINAALGGAVGIMVYLVVFPLHPLRLIELRARPVIDLFATELAAVADSLSTGDLDGVERAMHRLQGADDGLLRAKDALGTAMEVVTLAPARRHDRPILVAYNNGFEHLERALRNSRGTVRRLKDMIRHAERVPDSLPSAVRNLSDAAKLLHRDLLAGRSTQPAEATALHAAIDAQRAGAHDPGPNAPIAIAQIRTVVFDLLRASGADRRQARARIREATRSAGQPQ